MKWRRVRRNPNLRDVRGRRSGLPRIGSRRAGFPGAGSRRGSGMGIPIGGKLSLPLLLLVAAFFFFGGGDLFGGGGGGVGSGLEAFPQSAADDQGLPPGADPDADLVEFMNFLLTDIQATWEEQFAAAGTTYDDATFTIFDDAVDTACGAASSATGPFYCPPDSGIYLDLGFFRELRDRFGAPGDFAQAYVVAHEFGHHVQNELGISEDVRGRQQQDPDRANEYSVLLELQADCLAGVWAHTVSEQGDLESGDLSEALAAAAAVGDDRIQQSTSGTVNPETWTHGSSEQRTAWFRTGFDSGQAAQCDTFSQ